MASAPCSLLQPLLCLSDLSLFSLIADMSSPGSTVGACSKEESLALVAKAINKAHAEVPEVVCVVENMVSCLSA